MLFDSLKDTFPNILLDSFHITHLYIAHHICNKQKTKGQFKHIGRNIQEIIRETKKTEGKENNH